MTYPTRKNQNVYFIHNAAMDCCGGDLTIHKMTFADFHDQFGKSKPFSDGVRKIDTTCAQMLIGLLEDRSGAVPHFSTNKKEIEAQLAEILEDMED